MAFINEKIETKSFVPTAKEYFLDYAMSVIIARALPDVRDGLKPVHRRILFAMNELGITHDSPYKKSARFVGEVIGKYHPHGDTAVYDSMVRMSQWFKYLHPLIDMHGNNGSVDGDSPAAMRYTEARLAKISSEMLRGLKDGQVFTHNVDFQDNYDGEEIEPVVLPSRIPNLLINGTYGIAVGMTSDIPPHNLKEVCEAVIAQIKNPDITIEELMEIVKGPDFPTGGIIMGDDGIKKAYRTGDSSFKARGKAEIVKHKDGRYTIEITEIPYFVNRKKLEEEIWSLQLEYEKYKADTERPDKAENFIIPDGIETTIKGKVIKMVIHLRKTVDSPELVLNKLYKYTSLERSYNFKLVALVPMRKADGSMGTTPQVLNLKEVLTEYIKHQFDVVTRKYQYDLAKLEKQLHILEAFMKAFARLDETIKTIRDSKSRQEAIQNLCLLLTVDEIQAKEILERRIQTLANFEQDVLKLDFQTKTDTANTIRTKLSHDNLIYDDIALDLEEMIRLYGENRRTEISDDLGEIDDLSLIPNDPMVITLTNNGLIKRTEESSYRTQRRKGMGSKAQQIYEGDFINHLHVTHNHDHLLFFTNKGRVYDKEVFKIPKNLNSKGINIAHLLNLQKDEKIQSIMSISEFADNQYLFFATKNGMVKKTKLSEYQNIRSNGIYAIALKNDDEVINTLLTNGSRIVTLLTKEGKSISFSGDEIRSLSRKTQGVKGIRLSKGDEVVSSIVHEEEGELLIVTSLGYGKRTPLSDYRIQHIGGKGILTAKLSKKIGVVVGASAVQNEDIMMLMTQNATTIKVYVKEMAQSSRNTQGTKIIHLREGDQVNQIARILEDLEDE